MFCKHLTRFNNGLSDVFTYKANDFYFELNKHHNNHSTIKITDKIISLLLNICIKDGSDILYLFSDKDLAYSL